MHRKLNILLLYFLLLIELLILYNSKIIINDIKKTSIIFIINIFPSLFPTMLLGNLLVKCNIKLIIPSFIKKIFNILFNFDDNMTTIFIMSMLCGSPSNAMFINDYLEKGLINEKTAKNMLKVTRFINPLFVISTVGITIFNSVKIGILILIILYISNFIKAFLLRKNFVSTSIKDTNINNINFINELKITIKETINTLLFIFSTIITFNVLISLIKEIFNLNLFYTLIINSLLEMTSGIIILKDISIPLLPKILIAYLILSFSGLCIHLQISSIIKEKK